MPTCVWRMSTDLVLALHARFGPPVHAYVNGGQSWLRNDGPGGEPIEWRIHPVPRYTAPDRITHHEVFPAVALALRHGDEPPAPPGTLWDGLQAFPAYGDEIDPEAFTRAATDALGVRPDASGLIDHEAVGREWERNRGQGSIVDSLFRRLGER